MSDFLERLVERSRADLPPEIRPRLPSAFEAGLVLARESAAPLPDEREERPLAVHRGPLVAPPAEPPLRARSEPEPRPLRLEPARARARQAPAPRPGPAPEPRSGPPPAPRPDDAVPPAATEHTSSPPLEPRVQPAVPEAEGPSPERSSADGRDAAEAAPVIRVTIGRIDVRAVAEVPPPSSARRPAAPRLSLDEYLRERARGER
jgi:hypothetical protein